MSQSNFIDAAALRERLEAGDGSVVAVDCRFDLKAPHVGFSAYLSGHIPGARYAHLDKDLARLPLPGEGRHPLPDLDDFCAFLGAQGIDRETDVVAYDDQGGAIAARLWWLLGEAGHAGRWLLSGGLRAWTDLGLPTSTRLPDIVPRRYRSAASLNAPPITTDEIADFVAQGGRLLDARAPVRFQGREEPIDPVAGHVPGAINVPFSSVLDASARVLPADELAGVFRDAAGESRGGDIAVMCGSGVTACMLAATLETAGFGRARLYPGSWSEWIRDPARPTAGTASNE